MTHQRWRADHPAESAEYLRSADVVIEALGTLPAYVLDGVTTALFLDRSDTLRSIGSVLLFNPPQRQQEGLADALHFGVVIGDAEAVAPGLSDTEPWAGIAEAIRMAAATYRKHHPGLRTAHDRRQIPATPA